MISALYIILIFNNILLNCFDIFLDFHGIEYNVAQK